ncbi:MAG: primosomal protein N' [Calditrichaeota bacterium]|nr:MAG: primosomal protein N' [Calditrichota bacterium]
MKTEKPPFHIAEVVVPIPVDEPFSYQIPEEFKEVIQPGSQVIIPFGERYEAGIVLKTIETDEPPSYPLKPIYDVVSEETFVEPELLQVLVWIAGYYVCHLGEAFRLIHPSLNVHKSKLEIRKTSSTPADKLTPALQEVWDLLPEEEWVSLRELEKELQQTRLMYRIARLKSLNLLESRYSFPNRKKIFKTIDYFTLNPRDRWSPKAKKKYSSNGSRQFQSARELIEYLSHTGETSRSQLVEKGFGAHLIRRLESEQVLRRITRQIERTQSSGYAESSTDFNLFEEQQQFVDMVTPFLDPPRHKAFLLHGITGSGKTQIYIELIRKVLQQGRQAILLIPEIVLTPQTLARFHNEFGESVAVIHSRISRAEKLEVLQKIREDRFKIVIGPRSAIFAPFKHLGIIIVDEEHESSYKQSDGVPHYHARDVALYRAYVNNIPIVLGSATPSFESMYNAKEGKYQYYHLPIRIHSRNLPRTQLVNLKEEWQRTGMFPIFSENLLLKLESRLVCQEQAILLQNRRGFAPFLQCRDCGFVLKCPQCEVTLTYHISGKNMRCHYCGHNEPAPDNCPQCKGLDILYKGVGTQKIEEEAQERFPHARLIRMDQDTTRRKDDHARLLEKFRNGEADFLLGTKMIAKGLDFEKVTLVGILNADEGLHFPDFRAAEKVFQLLVQAAGRAGRGAQSGEVVIQTFDPSHYIFKFLMTHDYEGFYERELATRETLGYPPFSRLCLIRISGDTEDQVMFYAQQLSRYLWKANSQKNFRILGPAPAPLVKLKNKYRYQILIKQPKNIDPSMKQVRHLLKEGIYKHPEIKKWPVEINIDVDPIEIL